MNLVLPLAVLVLAGCMGTPIRVTNAPLPVAVQPHDSGTPWVAWTGPIASTSGGCGFCLGGMARQPEVSWTGIDDEGRVLALDFAQANGTNLTFMHPSLERWRPIVAPLFALGDEYGQDGHGMRVFHVIAVRLSNRDEANVSTVLAAARLHLAPLGPPNFDCSDCGAPVLKAGGFRVELYRNSPAGSGWPLISQQIQNLENWAKSTQS